MHLTDEEWAELRAAFAADMETRADAMRDVLALAPDDARARSARGQLLFQAHTLRGAAALLELTDVANTAQALEEALRRLSPGSGLEGARPAVVELLDALDRLGGGAPGEPGRGDAGSGPPVVLHIEDNEANRRLVAAILGRRPDVRLVEAVCGEEGLRLAETPGIALVLLDLRLPGISGEEVLRRLRSSSHTQDIRVVVVSAEARTDERDRLFAGGANDYLVKPYDVTSLLSIVDEAIARARA